MILPNLNNAPVVDARETPEENIMKYVREHGSINRKQAEHLLGVSQTAAGLILRRLVEQGELTREGYSRNVRYFVSKTRDKLEC
jgi:ATP-dependent DNA helicase RecG